MKAPMISWCSHALGSKEFAANIQQTTKGNLEIAVTIWLNRVCLFASTYKQTGVASIGSYRRPWPNAEHGGLTG
jgi:hypothetical protein